MVKKVISEVNFHQKSMIIEKTRGFTVFKIAKMVGRAGFSGFAV